MKGTVWQLQDAKNSFSQVVDLAVKSGAQSITKHGKPAVVIVSAEEYEALRKPKRSLIAALRECPEDLAPLIPERSREKNRAVKFQP